jgi:hypothetical protein
MKTLIVFLSITMLVILLALTGCKSDSDGVTGIPDITPANFDWDVYILDLSGANEDLREDSYYISCEWLGDESAITETDVFTIQFNDSTPIQLQGYGYWFGEWSFAGEAMLNPGTSYNVKLMKNGTQETSGTIKTPYRCYANFPAYYNPSTTAEITWSLSNNNQFQTAGISSYGDWEAEVEEYDEHFAELSPSARNYTIPANAVDNFGEWTEYEMLVMQVNFTKSGRTAFMATQGQGNNYEGTPTKDAYIGRLIRQAKQLRKQF